MELLDKQKRAMEKSIEHWEEVVADPTLPATADECECCRVFGCDLVSACVECRCPVAQYTKQDQCNGTPYYNHRSKKTKATALAMLNFLKVVYADLCRGKLKAAPKAPAIKVGDVVRINADKHHLFAGKVGRVRRTWPERADKTKPGWILEAPDGEDWRWYEEDFTLLLDAEIRIAEAGDGSLKVRFVRVGDELTAEILHQDEALRAGPGGIFARGKYGSYKVESGNFPDLSLLNNAGCFYIRGRIKSADNDKVTHKGATPAQLDGLVKAVEAVRKPKPPAPKFKRGDRVKLLVTGHTGTVVRENDPKEDVKLYCDDCDACFTMRASVLALLNSKVEG